MVKYISFIAFLGLIVVSCSNHKETRNGLDEKSDVTTISINLNEASPIHMSEFFSHIDYYYLESPPDRPIARIWKILVNENHIALLDRIRSSVWIYTKKGKYVNEIHIPQGRGPGELEKSIDFTFVSDTSISVLSDFKVVTYGFSGKFLSEFLYDYYIYNFTFNKETRQFIGNANNSLNRGRLEDGLNGHNLIYLDNSGNIEKTFLPIGKGKEQMGYGIPNNFPIYGDSYYYIPHLIDTIYTLHEHSVSAKYAFDFGKYSIPQEVYALRNNYSDRWYDWAEFKDREIDDKGYASNISVFAESDTFIYLAFQAHDKPHEAFYNKNIEKVRVGPRRMINDIDYGISSFIYEGFGNSIYTVLDTNELLRHLNDLYKNDPKKYSSSRLAPLRKLVHKMDDNRNPILMIAHYK